MRRGFTLIDLAMTLVMLTVLTLLAVAGFSRWRVNAQTDQCQDNIRTLSLALVAFSVDTRSLPPSYVYGSSTTGTNWIFADQSINPNPANGYVHWSGFLSAGGYTTGDAVYTCPTVPSGGAPRTNPGPNPANWEPGQVNDLGATSPAASPEDRQAPRMAYTVNHALMPRNKFSGGSPRTDRLVSRRTEVLPAGEAGRVIPEVVASPSRTTLLSEFLVLPTAPPGGSVWDAIKDPQTGVFKSHRPITPFVGVSSGVDVYSEPNSTSATPRFRCPSTSDIRPTSQLGPGMIVDSATSLNAVGRHHEGGTAHYAFLDGSVRRQTPQGSVVDRLWGERFHALTGSNVIQFSQP